MKLFLLFTFLYTLLFITFSFNNDIMTLLILNSRQNKELKIFPQTALVALKIDLRDHPNKIIWRKVVEA